MAGDGGNGPPRFVSPPHDLVFTEGQANTFTFEPGSVVDPDGDSVRLVWDVRPVGGGPVPPWLLIDPSGLTVSGVPPPGSPDLTVSVTPSDGQSNGTAERFTLITQAGQAGNRAPVVVVQPSEQRWTEGGTNAYALPAGTFSDPDGHALTLSAPLARRADSVSAWPVAPPCRPGWVSTPAPVPCRVHRPPAATI